MKHNIKNYLEQAYPGCNVTLRRINYHKDGSLSRTIALSPYTGFRLFRPDDSLDPKLELLAEACTVQADGHYCLEQYVDFEVDGSGNEIIKVYLKDLTWQEYEEKVCELVDWEEYDDEDPVEEESAYVEEEENVPEKMNVEAILDNLHVGMNVTPLGVGYASDEEDLKKMKTFLAGALAMARIFGL